MWIVKLALRRPYTFVVMALLILLLGAGDSLVANPSDVLRDGVEVKVQTQPSKNSDQQTFSYQIFATLSSERPNSFTTLLPLF